MTKTVSAGTLETVLARLTKLADKWEEEFGDTASTAWPNELEFRDGFLAGITEATNMVYEMRYGKDTI
jgi:hypothetical protein